MDNEITKIMKKLIRDDYVTCLCGTFKISDKKCELEERGGVYGIAIKLSDAEKEIFFKENNEKQTVSLKKWKPICKNYYPLYWGKDINLGFRLFDHTKSRKSTATLQLDNRKELIGKTVIYGAVLCHHIAENEKLLRKNYPDILKNRRLDKPEK